MILEIRKKQPNSYESLFTFKEYHWKGVNSLTHSGIMQLSYRFLNGEMKRKYPKDYSNTILDFANRFAILSLGNVGKIVSSKKIICCSINLHKKYLNLEPKKQ